MANDFGEETVTAVQVGLFARGKIIPNPATPRRLSVNSTIPVEKLDSS